MSLERVYTVNEYYDGPVMGVANYLGRPHIYKRYFDDAAEEYSDRFALRPIDSDTFAIFVRQWAIWCEWEIAFHSGERALESHPDYGGQNEEYDLLASEIDARLAATNPALVTVCGTFHVVAGQPPRPLGVLRELEVQWSASMPGGKLPV